MLLVYAGPGIKFANLHTGGSDLHVAPLSAVVAANSKLHHMFPASVGRAQSYVLDILPSWLINTAVVELTQPRRSIKWAGRFLDSLLFLALVAWRACQDQQHKSDCRLHDGFDEEARMYSIFSCGATRPRNGRPQQNERHYAFCPPPPPINKAICISGWATELDRVNTPNICTMQTEGHSLRQPVYPLQSPGAMRVRYCTLSTVTAASQRNLSASEHSSWFALRLFAWVTLGWPAQCGLHASEVPPWLQVSPPFPILACR